MNCLNEVYINHIGIVQDKIQFEYIDIDEDCEFIWRWLLLLFVWWTSKILEGILLQFLYDLE